VWLEFSSLSSTVRLDDLGAILGNALKRVHRNQNDATIGIDTMLCIAVPNGVKDWAEIEGGMDILDRRRAPEGSLRWDSVARSSAVSSRGGFRKGGRSSWPSLIALTVVSTVISWKPSEVASVIKRDAWTDLAPVVDKGKFDFVARASDNICDLCGNPTLFFICEPDPGSLAVNVLCHGPGGRRDDCSALSLFP
jgi:hypothetical protein